MAFRISSSTDQSGRVVRVEGRLDAAAVPGLLSECRAVGHPLRLDLSGLQSADAGGVRALRKLMGLAIEFRSMSPYIRHLVFEDGGKSRG